MPAARVVKRAEAKRRPPPLASGARLVIRDGGELGGGGPDPTGLTTSLARRSRARPEVLVLVRVGSREIWAYGGPACTRPYLLVWEGSRTPMNVSHGRRGSKGTLPCTQSGRMNLFADRQLGTYSPDTAFVLAHTCWKQPCGSASQKAHGRRQASRQARCGVDGPARHSMAMESDGIGTGDSKALALA